MTIILYACGHAGRENSAPYAKGKAFIRFAEVRDYPIDIVSRPCPNCKHSDA